MKKPSQTKVKKRPVGRSPEPVPQDVAKEIIEWISEGKTLREFCRQEGKPSYRSVYRWILKDDEFASLIARAREIGEDCIAEECLEIADDSTNDWMKSRAKEENDDKSQGLQFNAEHVNRSRLRIDTRLKLLAKWNPKKYGDKIDIEHSGSLAIDQRIVEARKRVGSQ